MKSPCCKHEIVIQTDPQNCAYVIMSGARQKVEEYDAEDAETLVLPVDDGECCVYTNKCTWIHDPPKLTLTLLCFR